jgi:hypothetical protein
MQINPHVLLGKEEADFVSFCHCNGTQDKVKQREEEQRQEVVKMAELCTHDARVTHVEMTCTCWKADISVFYLLPDPFMQVSNS